MFQNLSPSAQKYSDPDGVFRLFYHIRRPVIEDLDTTQLDTLVLYIDPAIRYNIAQCLSPSLIDQIQLVDQQSHGDKVAVRQTGSDPLYLGILAAVHAGDQILDRHRGNEDVAGNGLAALRCFTDYRSHLAVFGVNGLDAVVEQDLAALFLGFLADQFPKLSRTILRIPELFDQRGFRIFVVLLAGTLGDHVFQYGTDRQPLDTLSTPVCGDLAGVSAP